MGVLVAKLYAIATMISLPEMQFNIFMIWEPSIYSYRIGKVIFRESDLPHAVPCESLVREG